jgi:phenylalanyl-tRNA synthetase beta chain
LQWGERERAVDFHDLKGDVEALLAPRVARFVPDVHPALHPGRCARVELDGRAIGYLGELHPKWRQAYELASAPLLFEFDLDPLLERLLPAFQPLPRQQLATRDLALVVADGVTHERLAQALRDDPQGIVRSATLFDIFKPAQPGGGLGAGERSFAMRLEMLDDDATLTDERIDAAVAAALQRVQVACGARLRA